MDVQTTFFLLRLVLVAFSAAQTCDIGGSKERSATFTRIVKFFLNAPVIKSLRVRNSMSCAFSCLAETGCVSCVSFNIAAKSDAEGLLECHLLSKDKYDFTAKLISNTSFNHHNLETPCDKKPCTEPCPRCIPDYWGDSYSCACPEEWMQMNTDPVCIGAKDDKPGTFRIPYNAHVKEIKLVHLSGGMTCYRAGTFKNWGCGVKSIVLAVNNTYSSILPAGYVYPVDTKTAPEYFFNFETSTYLVVNPYNRYKLWYKEDIMRGDQDIDNRGTTCANVFVRFIHVP